MTPDRERNMHQKDKGEAKTFRQHSDFHRPYHHLEKVDVIKMTRLKNFLVVRWKKL